jgi:2-oxoglutarate ferredoxin oxidoreductase subunit beta
MALPEYPVAMGVIRATSNHGVVYEEKLTEQIVHAKSTNKIKSVSELLHSGNVFEIK